MKTLIRILSAALLSIISLAAFSQTTSWRGTTSTAWSTASNWTAGVPTATVDAILGDANFVGGNQPSVNATAACKSLTIGGAVTTTLTLTKNVTVSGGVTINTNGSVTHPASTLTLTGNWVNNGAYSTTSTTSKIVFGGNTQTIGGSANTTFRRITINTSSTVTLTRNITVSGSSSYIYIYGTLNPGESPTYTVTSTVLFRIQNNGRAKVNTATFAGNYILSGSVSMIAGSKVEYSSTTVNQTISNSYSYSTLIISGTGIKTLAGNLPSLNSTASTRGNILVTSATLDLAGFTANRGTTTAGGEINVANGATLKIGGITTFPANYATRILNLSSTTEYYGTNQTVSAQTYGNLILSSSAGSVTKTMPVTAFTIEGNFTSTIGAGTAVAYTAASAITMNGIVTIGTATTFNGGSFSHIVRGNWINSGTFTGSTSTITFDGASTSISGAGTHNFNNLSFSSTGITATASTTLSVAGNLATTGAGQFTQYSPGLLTMTGTTKTITGTNITLNDLTISGSVTTNSSLLITGDLAVAGSLAGSAGTVTMTGTAKTISGAGTIGFSTLAITGTVTTGSSFSISALLDVSGTFTASVGTATFTGTSLLTGTANLYNVTINGTSLQLSTAAVLGIANVFTITAGSLNVTSSTPNTVNFNGAGVQTVNAITYHHLSFSTGGTKTAAGNFTVNGNISIAASTTLNGSSYTHTILRNWINNGTYTASTSTVQFTGVANASITGATIFNTVTLNKASTSNTLTLQNNVTAATVNMTTGTMLTGSNTLTITSTRTGNGIILGTITRTHAFAMATAYAFEGPDNTITFSVVTGVTSITVTVTPGSIGDFPDGASINREYAINVPAGTYVATLRLHYEDAELNGSDESTMQLWNFNAGSWATHGKTGNNTTTNYVEETGVTNISYRWTCSDNSGVISWNGSVSSNWNTAANWTTVSGSPSTPPAANDIVQIGTAAFTNQPSISSAVTVKSITFGSAQAATLTLAAGGSLTTNGNIGGSWTANALHTINAGNQTLTVNGSLSLSNGVTNRAINLNIGTGTVVVSGTVTQSANSAVSFSGAGILQIGNNYTYSAGSFTAGAGTVVYNGATSQAVAALNYNNLTINKAAGIATLLNSVSLTGNLTLTGGELEINGSTATIAGNVSINTGTTLDCDGVTFNVAGNWSNSGTYISTTGSVYFNGTGAQTISAGRFNNLIINKAAGIATLTGNNIIDGNLTLQAGSLDLVTYTANRSSSGGSLTINNTVTLFAGGTNNFPTNYSAQVINSGSLVHYNGAGAQSVAGVTYGNISFSNGGATAKTFLANSIINGDITINAASTLHSGGYTVTLGGNWNNSGTFTASTGTVVLHGIAKTITGTTSFNHVTVDGSYTVTGSNITYNGHLQITTTGSFAAGGGIATVSGDLTNSGSLTSTGTTTFTGTTVQTIRLINALVSTSTGIVNFNGNISPVMNSTSSPQFATLNINNTAGVNPSVPWTVFIAMNVNSGGIFNGGLSDHYIYGSFANSGTTTSTGTLHFIPSTAKTVSLGSSGFSSTGTVNFGGAGLLTITGTPTLFTDILISNTNAAGVSPATNWVMNGSFVVANDAIFNAGAYTYTVGVDVESNGTLNGGTSTFIMTGAAGELTASAETAFNHFTVAGSVTPQTDFRVGGNFTNNGTYDGTIGVLIMNGANAATIGGTTSPSTIAQLTIEKAAPATTVTQNVSISNVLFLNIFSGTLFTSTNTITQDAGGGILIIADNATLKLGGTNSVPGFSGYGLDANSFVDYAGTTQSVGNAAIYGNILISATGNKNAFVPIITQGDIIITAGTFATSTVTVTHTIGGNWTMTGGAFTGTSSTILFNGTIDQTISSTGSFVNMTINKASGMVYLGSNVTTNNQLNMTAGKITLGNYNFTMGTAGNIINANATNYLIAVGTGSLVQQVTNSGTKSFPIGSTAEYLPAIVTLTAGSTTDNFSARLFSTVYKNGTTGAIVTTGAVNNTWMISEAINGGSNATITLQWPASLEQPGFVRSTCYMAHYTGSSWDYGVANISAAGANPYTATRAGLTSFSPFVMTTYNPLPVTWLSFAGNRINNDNQLNWSTASELNNAYFVIEVSADGNNFTELGRVTGAGNTTTVQHYSFIHYNTADPINYYRIKQVDIDGRSNYSKVIKIVSAAIFNSLSLSPNPGNGIAALYINTLKTASTTVTIADISGKTIWRYTQLLSRGSHQVNIDLSDKPAGIYFLTVFDDNGKKQTFQYLKK